MAIFLAIVLGVYPNYDVAADVMVPKPEKLIPEVKDVAVYRSVFRKWTRLNKLSREFDKR